MTESQDAVVKTNVAKHTTGVFALRIGTYIMSFVGTFFVAHLIGVDKAGLVIIGSVNAYLLLTMGMTVLGELRLGAAMTYFVSRGGDVRQYLGTYFTLVVATVGAGTVGVLAFSSPLLGSLNVVDRGGFLALMATPMLDTFRACYASRQTVTGNATKGAMPELVRAVILAAGLIAAAFSWRTTEGIGFAYLAAYGAVGAWTLLAIVPHMAAPSYASAKRLLTYGWAPAVASFCWWFGGVMTPFFVLGIIGTAGLALFNVSDGLGNTIMIVPSSLSIPLFPKIAAFVSRNDWKSAKGVTSDAVRCLLLAVAPVAMLVAVTSPELLVLMYGKGFAGAAMITTIIAFSVIPGAVMTTMAIVLQAIGKQRIELVIAFGILIPAAAGFWLTGWYGLVGAGISIIASSTLGIGIGAYLCQRFGVLPSARSFLPIAPALVFVVGFWFVHTLAVAIVFVLASLAYYYAVVVATGIAKRGDIENAIRIFRIPRVLADLVRGLSPYRVGA